MTIWAAAVIVVLVTALLLEERSGLLPVGSAAPAFTAQIAGGGELRLAEYAGKNSVVLFFYPGDFTPGCTEQACAFRDAFEDISRAGAVVFGVSGDPDASHRKFAAAYRLPFPLINDSDRSLARAFGVLRLGGLVPVPKRVTYVIDRRGIIRLAAHHELRMQRHVGEVQEMLRQIQEE
jgi:peroxiredoxin Q/BCP